MGNRVFGAVTAVELQLAGGRVHRVGPDVHAASLLAQRVYESIADTAHTGRLVGAAGEDDLGVGAVGGGRNRRRARGHMQDGGDEQCRSAQARPTTG